MESRTGDRDIREPELDSQGGADVRAASGTGDCVLRSDTLRFLTVTDSPALRVLDLSQCPNVAWVAVADCPNLHHVRLASNGAGAELHIDFGESAPRLTVEGLVSDFDCCWANGSLSAPRGRHRRVPLNGLYLGPVEPDVLDLVSLALFCGGSAATLRLTRGAAVRELVIAHSADLEVLEVDDLGEPVCLELYALPRLNRVGSASPVKQLRAADCARLEEVDGWGDSISLVASAVVGGRPLRVLGPWQRLSLRDSARSGLRAPLVEDVAGAGEPKAEAAEAEVGRLVTAAGGGDTKALQAVLNWCRRVRTPRGTLGALLALEALARADHDVAVLWEIRCDLHARTAGGANEAADWSWKLPRDLELRGWSADLTLWLRRCERRDAPVELGRVWRPVHLAALAHGLQSASDAEAVHLQRLLRAGLGSRRYGRRDGDNGCALPSDDLDHVRRVLQALVVLRHHAWSMPLVRELCGWLFDNVRGPTRAQLLGALHLLGSADAHARLLTIAADTLVSGEERSRAFALAMTPVRAQTFSTGQEMAHG